ncbi:amino acid adenylation domain-containing protein [Micromonospora sp. MSM11]|nr:non-ribosomal peptide synthetase [Micromonospora sp. MSM11]MCL7460191.1 amino acid adenylation domain-containing protein [Micromonospora sp. MSM11]
MTEHTGALTHEATDVVNLGAALSHQARFQPGSPALHLVAEDGSTDTVDYATLDARARRVGAALAGHCRPGDRVLMLVGAGVDFLAGFFGCLYAGTVPVPLAARLNRASAPVVGRILDDAQATAVLAARAVTAAVDLGTLMPGRRLPVLEIESLDAAPAGWQPVVDEGGLAFLQYTSGTTSTPKGVMVSHANLLENLRAIRRSFAFDDETVMASWLPPHHDMGLIGTLLTPVYLGVPTVLMDPATFIRTPVRWLEAISRYRATISGGPNFAYDLCVRKVAPADRAALDLSSWRVAFNGAEPVRAATLRAFAEAFAPHGFDERAFLPCYGLAEATLLVAGRARPQRPVVTTVADDDPTASAAARPGTEVVGCEILPEAEVRIVDAAGQPVADGTAGEIWVRGGSVVDGYWNRPEESARTLHATLGDDPADGPYLRTGDLGFQQDGHLYVRGRIKETVVIRGQNHYPDDIEQTVRAACPRLGGRIAAFGVDVADDGHGVGEAVVLWYETRSDKASDEAPAIAEAARRAVVTVHGLDLHRVLAVPPGTIPVTTSGKTRRGDCARAYAAGSATIVADDPLRPAARPAPAAAPAQAQRLRVLAGGLIEVDPERIDPERTLPELGFDSLRAVELQHLIEGEWGVRPSLTDLLGDSTVAELAAALPAAPAPADPPAAAPAADRPYPLSYGQRAIWFQGALADDPANLNLSRAVTVDGELDVDALARAVRDLGVRHPALLTRYDDAGAEVTQRVVGDAEITLDVRDATHWPAGRLDAEIEAELGVGFDGPPLLRAVLFRQAADRHTLLLCTHHSVMDVWSLAVLVEDLATGYGRHAAGDDAAPPAPTAHPAEFVAWQRSFLDGAAGRELTATCQAQVADLVPLDLPTDRPRPSVRTFRGAAHAFRLGPDLCAGIDALAASHGVSRTAVLFAGYAAVLSRYAGQAEFPLGFVHAGRVRGRFADLVSYLVNPLAVPVDLSGDPEFGALARAAHDAVLAASDRAEVPFGRIVEGLGQAADPSRGALISAAFAYQHGRGTDRLGLAPMVLNHEGALGDWAGLRVRNRPVRQRATYYDLSLYLGEHGGELLGTFDYSTDLFDADTVGVLAEALTALLAAAVAAPATPVGALPLLSAEGQRRVLVEWNDTTADYDTDRCAPEIVAEQARRSPHAPAAIDDTTRLTYAELNAAANRLAHRLIRLGAGRGTRVGLLVPRSTVSLTAVLAILKTGAAYVPLDPSYPVDRLRFMLADSGARLLVAAPDAAADLPDVEVVDPAGEPLAAEDDRDPRPTAHPDDVAYVVYTSGSTGTPRGVLGLHRGIVNRQRWIMDRFPMGPDEVGSHKTSLSFFDSGGEMFLPLFAGAPLVVVPEDVGRDPVRLVDLLARHRVTRLVAVPSLLRAILDGVPDAGERLSALRYCHSSGEALTPDLAARWLAALPGCVLVDLYGSSEISADVTLDVVTGPERVGSVGRPIGNTRVYVLDEALRPVPPRFAGEVYVGGAGLARGYLDQPALTAARFVPDPYGSGERLFRTGDRGRFSHDGRLEFLGRADHQVKVRGFRIELGEIEATLRAHPGVAAAVAALAEAPGGGKQRIVAAVVPRQRSGSPASTGVGPGGAPATNRVSDWRLLYDRMYTEAGPAEEAQQAIWTSSYTGAPFTDVEMGEWIDQAVRRIRELRPRRLLELGCGTGNLTLALAPDCETYVGTDFSAAGLKVLEQRLDAEGIDRGSVTLLLREADDVTGIEAASFDTVVLHSVTQYFPNHDYLREVLRAAVTAAAPGGRIYLGDVRDLDLLEVFHASVELGAEPEPGLTVGELRRRVAARVLADDELVLAPDLFLTAGDWLPGVTGAELHLKRGRQANELSAFRYDVVLHVGADPQRPATDPLDPLRLDWAGDALDVARLRSLLRGNRNRPVEVRGVPNARLVTVAGPVRRLAGLADADPVTRPAGGLPAGVDPEDCWSIGEALGRRTSVVPSTERDPYAMDLRFWPAGRPDDAVGWTPPGTRRGGWPELANDPLRATARRDLLHDLRTHLRQRLPEFMVPLLHLVDELPTTATGKVSRRAVAAEATEAMARLGAGATARPPTAGGGGLQAQVTEVWLDVLGVGAVGLDDNFFDVGGNSLSLVQVHIRLQELIGRQFPLVDLYEHTTVRKLAEHLGEPARPAAEPPADPGPDRTEQVANRRRLMRQRIQEVGSR